MKFIKIAAFAMAVLGLTTMTYAQGNEIPVEAPTPTFKSIPNSSGRQNQTSGFNTSDVFGIKPPSDAGDAFIPNNSGRRNQTSGFNTSDVFGVKPNQSFNNGFIPNTTGDQNGTTGFRDQNPFGPFPTIPRENIPRENIPRTNPRNNPPTNTFPPRFSNPPPTQSFSNLPIQLRVPSWSTGTCRYTLITARGTRYNYSIGSGQSQSFTENTQWTIEYDPGNGQPRKSYRFRGGKIYELQFRDGAWNLYMLN